MTAPRSQQATTGRHGQTGVGAADTDVPSVRYALFVGADEAMLRQCRDLLNASGFVVDAADSGIAALVAVRKRLPDLIVMERQLRDVAGGEALGWLRSNPALRSTPVIVLTTGMEDDG